MQLNVYWGIGEWDFLNKINLKNILVRCPFSITPSYFFYITNNDFKYDMCNLIHYLM